MATQKVKAVRADTLFVPLRQDPCVMFASADVSDAFGNADELEPDGSALVGMYRLEKKIRVNRRHEIRPY